MHLGRPREGLGRLDLRAGRAARAGWTDRARRDQLAPGPLTAMRTSMLPHPAQSDPARSDARGQIIVVFALALVTIIGMVGLVIDGGGAFAQRRTEQKVADLAAIAGANAYMNTTGSVTARSNAA